MNATHGTCHEVHFIDEIFSGCFPMLPPRRVRITGKVESYNAVSAVAQMSDPERRTKETLSVNLENIVDIPFKQGSVFQIFGELVEKDRRMVLIATTARNVDGLDFQMYREVIELQRKFISESE